MLADKASGKAKGEVVPYRDAALTRILQTALGGNSKTIMICALSPSFMNYEETLSTLRYAERAKKIKNAAMINESVQDKIIRELKEENAKLRKMIKDIAKASAGGQVVDLAALGITENMDELIENMEENEKILEDMETPWEEKLARRSCKRRKTHQRELQSIWAMMRTKTRMQTSPICQRLVRPAINKRKLSSRCQNQNANQHSFKSRDAPLQES